MLEEVEPREEEDEEEADNGKEDRQRQRTRCQLHGWSCIMHKQWSRQKQRTSAHGAIWAKMKSELIFQ